MAKVRLSEETQIVQALLRQIRMERGLRQKDIAAALGWWQSDISKYELGKHQLNLPELDRVCTAMNTSVGQLTKRYHAAVLKGQPPEPGIRRRVHPKKIRK